MIGECVYLRVCLFVCFTFCSSVHFSVATILRLYVSVSVAVMTCSFTESWTCDFLHDSSVCRVCKSNTNTSESADIIA